MNLRYILWSVFAVASHMLVAQTRVSFEASDFKNISDYDSWAQSPFRTGRLRGHIAIADNPDTAFYAQLGYAPNPTAKVLAFQRSRLGSNTYGARIDLVAPFSLSADAKFVHVLLRRPNQGRVMLIGLGKRNDKPDQSAETEQFWEQSLTEIPQDKWADAVFPVRGAEGVEIYSLVLIPDLESTHNLAYDYAVFIDEIEVSSDDAPRIQFEDYPVNFSKATTLKARSDRGIETIGFGADLLDLTAELSDGFPLYSDHTDHIFPLEPTSVLQPECRLRGTWMNTYCYIDYNRNGRFEPLFTMDGTPADRSELVSFSYLSGIDSAGRPAGDGNTAVLPPFRLPSDLPYGFYRVRFKSDWDNANAGGNIEASNHLQQNGGGIVDATICLHGTSVTVTEDNRNGDVRNPDGSPLRQSVPYGQAFTVRLRPENGFTFSGIRVRHGYGHQGEQYIHGVRQFVDDYLLADKFDKDNCCTIPAEWVDGDVTLEGLFVQQQK